MRVLIAAAGSQHKWGGHLGVVSHLVPDRHGEPILARTIRQVSALTGDVHLVCPDDPCYDLPGVTRHVVGPEGNEYTASRPWWNTQGRTVLLLGDVWFTDAAIAAVAGGSPTAYRAFGRFGASRHTGTPYGEIFAISWGAQRHAQMDAHLVEVARLRESGQCLRPPGWVLLRLWQGTPVGRHAVRAPYFVTVDDLTDDIDYPADYGRHPAFGGGFARR